VEESELSHAGLGDGLQIGAEGLDPVSSRVVDGDELRHAFQEWDRGQVQTLLD
jgi:hypothetical protein